MTPNESPAALLPELIAKLRERYKASAIPACRVCSGPLSIQSCGGGRPTVYGCDGQEDDPNRPGWLRYRDGRRCADQHYSDSQWTDYSSGGDSDVLQLCDLIASTAPVASESCVEGLADEWFAAFVRPVAQLLRCLPSYFPAGNEHILRKLRELVGASESRGSVPDGVSASMFRSRLFQMFLSQKFWHAHHVDLVWRYNGEDVREEADWLSDVWYALLLAPTPPAVSNGEPKAEHWKAAIIEYCGKGLDGLAEKAAAWIERNALARSAAAKGEG